MKHWLIGTLTIILLIGAGSYIHNLTTYADLWVDEGWSAEVTHFSNLIEATEFIAQDVHPPLYFELLYVWEGLTGNSVFALRYFSVLIVLISASLIFTCAKSMVSVPVGLLGTSLYLAHDLVYVLGREVRQYPFLQLVTILTIFTYWRFWQHPDRRRGIIFVLSGAALLWTHYWGGFVLLALFLHFLFTRRHAFKSMLIAFVAIGLLFVPWLPVLYMQVTQNVSQGIGHALPANTRGYNVLAFQLLGQSEILWTILLCLGVYALYKRAEQMRGKALLLSLAVFVPLGLSLILNEFYASLSFRVLSLTIPVIVILIASVITIMPRMMRLPVGLLFITLSVAFPSAEPPLRLPWQPVAEYVSLRSDDTDAVLIETWFDTHVYTYYLREQGKPDFIESELMTRDTVSLDVTAITDTLGEALSGDDGIWVTRFSPLGDIAPVLNELGFTQTGTVRWETGLAPIELWRFDRIEPSATVTAFDNQMRINDYSLIRHDDVLTVELLWSTMERLNESYVVSVFLLDDDGVLVAQSDSPPLNGNQPTNTWEPEALYYDAHVLDVTNLSAGNYQVGVKVYWFRDSDLTDIEIIPPTDCEDDCEFILLSPVEIGG